MPSEFFGSNSESYNQNIGSDLLQVDFANSIARPALGSTMESMIGGGKGGCCNCKKNKLVFNKELLQIVSKILKEHKIKIDKSLKQELINTINSYIYLITNKLYKGKKNLNLNKMKSIIKKSGCYKLTI